MFILKNIRIIHIIADMAMHMRFLNSSTFVRQFKTMKFSRCLARTGDIYRHLFGMHKFVFESYTTPPIMTVPQSIYGVSSSSVITKQDITTPFLILVMLYLFVFGVFFRVHIS